MAITYVGGQVGGRAGATSTTNITYSLSGGSNTTPQAGDLVIITVVVASQARTPACAVTAPATWVNLTQINANGTTYDTSLNVSRKFMGGTPDTTFTLPSTGNIADAQSYTVQVWRGVNTTTPFDATEVSASGTATGRPNPGAITPTTTGAYVLICGGGAAATGANYVAPANYTTNFLTETRSDTNDSMIGSGYRAWTSGAEDPAAYTGGTANAVDSWACYTLALRPAVNNYALTCNSGSYAVTGKAATLTKSKLITANSGTYSLTGQSATVSRNRVLSASNGTYSVAGQSAEITKAGAAGYTLTALSGTYSLTGQSAGISRNRVLSPASGSYSLTGQSATLSHSRLITAEAGSYSLSGQSAVIAYSGEAPVETGGSGNGRKKRVYLERDGKVLVFANASRAAAYVSQEKAVEASKTVTEARGKPQAKKVIPKPQKKEIEPLQVVSIDVLQLLAKQFNYEDTLSPILRQHEYAALIALYEQVALDMDEEEVLMLLLAG